MQKETNTIKEEKEFGNGGGCFLFWGEEDKTYAVIGKIVVGFLTLGVLPLIWLIKCKKGKNSTEQSVK